MAEEKESLELKYHELTKIVDIRIIKRNFVLPINDLADFNLIKFNSSIADHIEKTSITNTYLVSKNISVVLLSQTDIELANVSVVYTFEFTDVNQEFISLSESADTPPKSIYTPSQHLNNWFNNVVIATTRGILVSELRGAFPFDPVILPLLRPDSI
jgi:hypothetical protein